jgi:hypothetical protein
MRAEKDLPDGISSTNSDDDGDIFDDAGWDSDADLSHEEDTDDDDADDSADDKKAASEGRLREVLAVRCLHLPPRCAWPPRSRGANMLRRPYRGWIAYGQGGV